MKVSKVWVTPEAEKVILYCARVSSPHQESGDTKLLRYLVKHKHWSPFEMASMCLEIETSRAVGRQLLRHRSLSFQEFSQRFAEVDRLETMYPRWAVPGNRQSSGAWVDDATLDWWNEATERLHNNAVALYQEALDRGIARECARMVLSEAMRTRLYASGTMRSWIHFVQVRSGEDTQWEHRKLALEVRDLLDRELPVTMAALGDAEPLAELAVQVANPVDDHRNR